MALIRRLPPVQSVYQTIKMPRGQNITAVPGSFLDVASHDADILEGNGWTRLGEVGPTSARPVTQQPGIGLSIASRGKRFIDTTLGAVITWDGATWRDTSGNAV